MRTLFSIAFTALTLAFAVPVQAGAQLSASPFSVYFPQTEVNSTSFGQTVHVRNTGDETAKYIHVMNSCIGEFRVYDTCGMDLEPYQSCTISVTFSPYRAGHHSCSISVSASGAGSANVSVSGSAIDRRNP